MPKSVGMTVHRAVHLLPYAVVVTEATAIVCQFVQRTDPRFPLVYFTVCSGVLASAVALCQATGRMSRSLGAGQVAAAVGVVASATVFAAVIAPATDTGTWFQPWDDLWVQTATVLFHGVTPVLVAASLILTAPALTMRCWLAVSYSWPALYVMAIAAAAVTRNVPVPYPFLSPSEMGWRTTLTTLPAMAALIALVSIALYGAAAARRRITS